MQTDRKQFERIDKWGGLARRGIACCTVAELSLLPSSTTRARLRRNPYCPCMDNTASMPLNPVTLTGPLKAVDCHSIPVGRQQQSLCQI
jgi:hypothetical protein